MELKLLHDNVLIKIKKQNNLELVTASGIVLANVEQDTNVAIIVQLPELDYYYEDEKQPDGTIEIKKRWISDLNPGDAVVMEKDFHHDYDWHYRNKIDHTISVKDIQDDEYDYYLTKYRDILGKFDSIEDVEQFGNGSVYGELYTTIAPKQIKRVGSI